MNLFSHENNSKKFRNMQPIMVVSKVHRKIYNQLFITFDYTNQGFNLVC